MACINHPDVITGLDRCSKCGKDFCQDCLISLQGAVVCAGCKNERVMDIRSGTAGELDLAGAGARLGAAILDGIIVGVPFFGLAFALGLINFTDPEQSKSGFNVLLTILSIILPGIYEGAMLAARGQTIGKMAIRAKVVNADGTPLTGMQPWTRAFSRTIMSATQILGLIDPLFIFSKERATLHDRIARTRVVRNN